MHQKAIEALIRKKSMIKIVVGIVLFNQLINHVGTESNELRNALGITHQNFNYYLHHDQFFQDELKKHNISFRKEGYRNVFRIKFK